MEQLRDSFTQEYHRKTVLRPDPNICDKPISGHNFHLYSYGALHKLLAILSDIAPDDSIPEEDNAMERYAVRFVVDTDGSLWFAQEGKRTKTVPAHSEMRNRCRAAGTLFFSEDYRSIIKITNTSGHFKPHIGSLIWALAALLSVKAPISSSVILDFFPIAAPISITRDDLVTLLPEGPLPQSNSDDIIETEHEDHNSHSTKKQRKMPVEPLPSQEYTLTNHSFELNFFSQPNAGVTNDPLQTPPQSPRRG